MKIKESFSVLEAARTYVQRGFFVVPVPLASTTPSCPVGRILRLTENELADHFGNAGGIGLLLDPSEIADVDLDCPEAVVAGRVLLPRTEMVHGHRSNPASHCHYRPRPATAPREFRDPLRATGDAGRSMLIQTQEPRYINSSTNERATSGGKRGSR
jgi:hypothetical protein